MPRRLSALCRRSALLLCVVWLVAAPALAQSAAGRLLGIVSDQQGAVVPGATVSLENPATGLRRTTVSDTNGRYAFIGVAPGSYELRVELPGFETDHRAVTLTVSEESNVEIALRPAGIEEQVAVAAVERSVDTRTAVGRTILQDELSSLPVAGRDFASLALLTPGILPNQSPILKNTSPIVAAGQTGRSNTFLLDGASLDDTFQANPRGGVPLDAVREFVVLTDGYGAQYGQASGAIVSVVTRSGGNRYQGGASYLLRDQRLDASSPLTRISARSNPSADASFAQDVAALSAGGPIRRNGIFFFGAVEGTRTVTDAVTTSPALSVFRPGVSPVSTVRNWHWQGFGRVDAALGRGQLTINYRLDRTKGPSSAGGALSPESRNDGVLDDQEIGLTHHYAWTDAENEIGFTVARRFWSFDRGHYCSDPCPPFAEVRPGITLGANPGDGIRTTEEYAQLREVLTRHLSSSWGDHSVTAGTTAMLIDGRFLGAANWLGTFSFANDLPFDPANPLTYPRQYTETRGDPDVALQHVVSAWFLQDKWTARPRISVDAGIRWDYDSLAGVSHDWNNVAPRIGAEFALSRSARTVVRGSYGRFFDQTFEIYVRQYHQAVQTTQVTALNPGYRDWRGFNPIAGRVSEAQVNARQLAEIQTPGADRATVGLRHSVGEFQLSVDAAWGDGRNLLETFDANPPDASGHRPDPAHQVVRVVRSAGRSSYRGLEVGVTKRFARGDIFSTAYTLSSAAGDVEGFEFTPQNQRDPSADWGPLASDVRHQLVASGSVHLPLEAVFGWLMTIRSAAPYTEFTGTDTNADGFNNDRPEGVPRNSERGAGFFQLDARCVKPFRFGRAQLELSAEAFNLTNHANWAVYDGVRSSTIYGLPTAAGIARQIQLGAHVRF